MSQWQQSNVQPKNYPMTERPEPAPPPGQPPMNGYVGNRMVTGSPGNYVTLPNGQRAPVTTMTGEPMQYGGGTPPNAPGVSAFQNMLPPGMQNRPRPQRQPQNLFRNPKWMQHPAPGMGMGGMEALRARLMKMFPNGFPGNRLGPGRMPSPGYEGDNRMYPGGSRDFDEGAMRPAVIDPRTVRMDNPGTSFAGPAAEPMTTKKPMAETQPVKAMAKGSKAKAKVTAAIKAKAAAKGKPAAKPNPFAKAKPGMAPPFAKAKPGAKPGAKPNPFAKAVPRKAAGTAAAMAAPLKQHERPAPKVTDRPVRGMQMAKDMAEKARVAARSAADPNRVRRYAKGTGVSLAQLEKVTRPPAKPVAPGGKGRMVATKAGAMPASTARALKPNSTPAIRRANAAKRASR